MKLVKVIGFMLLLGTWGQASADLEAVLDLERGKEARLVTRSDAACEYRCLEIHRIDGFALFILRDDAGKISTQMQPWLGSSEDSGLEGWGPDEKSTHDSFRMKPAGGKGGNCEYEKVNCVETFIIPGGYVVVIEYGLNGDIKSHRVLPVLYQQK
ncbi:MAG TPA: hypothetical protein EYP34_11740 [Chromatiaceae bacterium]|nr:hypothetical protein [Chromatiaceae bacterium]